MKKLLTSLVVILCFSLSGVSQSYNFDGLLVGATGSLSNGWTVVSTTSYAWLANADTTISPGTGPTVDYSLGNTQGIYMYTEASLPAALGDETTLTSPVVSTVSLANAALSFWYHMAGTAVGTIYIDVFSNGTWTNGVDSLVGAQQAINTDPWLNKVVSLASFSNSIQVRFRAICGTGWSGDMAIDAVSFVELNPFDLSLNSVTADLPYYAYPSSQFTNLNFSAEVQNVGASSVTGISVAGTMNGMGMYSGSLASLSASAIASVSLSPGYNTNTIGVYELDLVGSVTENDTVAYNDSATFNFAITDTVLARENDGIVGNGIGFTGGTGIFGQMMEVFNQDTMTSVSVKLSAPTSGDSIRVIMYHWNDTTGLPSTAIDSTPVFIIPSASAAWYTLQFPCNTILDADKYFFGVRQISTNNLSMAYTTEYYESDVTFYNSGSGWTSFESVGFNVSLALRVNFGHEEDQVLSLGADTSICPGQSINLSPLSLGWGNFLWENGSVTSTAATLPAFGGDTVILNANNARGCPMTDTIVIQALSAPSLNMASTGVVCNGVPITLSPSNDPNYNYAWSNGSSDSVISVSSGGLYQVTVTDPTNNCNTVGITVVQVGSSPTISFSSDTVLFCTGGSAQVTASGGSSYQWSNGNTNPTTTVNATGYINVIAQSSEGCVSTDSVYGLEVQVPTIAFNSNTAEFCDGDSYNISVSSNIGSGYVWNTGETTQTITVGSSGFYHVTVTNLICSSSDSIEAIAYDYPAFDLGADTVICDTSVLNLTVMSGFDNYQWSTGESSNSIFVTEEGTYWLTATNGPGCSTTDSIVVDVDICSSVNEIGSALVQVYPNPATSQFQIDLTHVNSSVHLRVFNAAGSLIHEQETVTSKSIINCSEWGAGMYFLQIESAQGIQNHSIMIQ